MLNTENNVNENKYIADNNQSNFQTHTTNKLKLEDTCINTYLNN